MLFFRLYTDNFSIDKISFHYLHFSISMKVYCLTMHIIGIFENMNLQVGVSVG